jgi:acyl-coenzyme A thioesterase PaaI-like protein
VNEQNSSALRSDGNTCFVCGPDNPSGMQIAFRLEDNMCRAEYTPPEEYCGYSGVTHGGILFSLLDDVMANWLYLKGERAYTGRCQIRFRETAPTGAKLLLEGELISRKGRSAKMAGRAILADTGATVAEAEATFMVIPD